jgi:cob(I)alamin adenosyltransferase
VPALRLDVEEQRRETQCVWLCPKGRTKEMKIYTRAGDGGDTALFGGRRVSKADARVEAYGTIDELNASLGVAVAALTPRTITLAPLLSTLQAELFDLGAELATPPERQETRLTERLVRIGPQHVEALEAAIDRHEELLDPLKNFILPGGSSPAAHLHLARTIARRAERRMVQVAAHEPLNSHLIRYINRLSDLLFVLARAANRLEGIADVVWTVQGSGQDAE